MGKFMLGLAIGGAAGLVTTPALAVILLGNAEEIGKVLHRAGDAFLNVVDETPEESVTPEPAVDTTATELPSE